MKRLVIVGAGGRCLSLFVGTLRQCDCDVALVGIFDPNRTRCQVFRAEVGEGLVIYDDFEQMLREAKPDGVIVTTTDNTHAHYAVRAMELGYDVYCEKPLANTFEDCLAIREAEKRTGKRVTVTFNCRYMPYFAKLKELIATGVIGKIHAVHYEYDLERIHGGDYMKRWHGESEISKGLLLHKSTHHFDVVSWLLEDEAEVVSAMGLRSFYGNPARCHGERCSTCTAADTCENARSQGSKKNLKRLYFDAEHEDGYIRDRCAHRPDADIYDNMSVTVRYRRGTLLTYTLNLFAMHEGYRMTLIGENGMIVAENYGESTPVEGQYAIRLYRATDKPELILFPVAEGAHGGGDRLMLQQMLGKAVPDPLGQAADSFAGVSSAMIGICANESIKTGRCCSVTEKLNALR